MSPEQKHIVWGVVLLLIIGTLYILYARVPTQNSEPTDLDAYSVPAETAIPETNNEALQHYSAPADTAPSMNDALDAYSVPQ